MESIFSHISDPRSLCCVASTCQEYHTLVNENDATIWKALYQYWWKRGRRPQAPVWKEFCRARFQRDEQAARHLAEMVTSMIEYPQDATSILSLVPLWNPSDDVCWRELMELGVDVLEMCLRMYQASVAKLATTSICDQN